MPLNSYKIESEASRTLLDGCINNLPTSVTMECIRVYGKPLLPEWRNKEKRT